MATYLLTAKNTMGCCTVTAKYSTVVAVFFVVFLMKWHGREWWEFTIIHQTENFLSQQPPPSTSEICLFSS